VSINSHINHFFGECKSKYTILDEFVKQDLLIMPEEAEVLIVCEGVPTGIELGIPESGHHIGCWA
jgi:hypothetical protein